MLLSLAVAAVAYRGAGVADPVVLQVKLAQLRHRRQRARERRAALGSEERGEMRDERRRGSMRDER